MQETSVGSSFQVNSAVVQNTCRRLCQVQVQVPLPLVSRQPAARYACLSDPAWRARVSAVLDGIRTSGFQQVRRT
jgi:hypothetical protein